MPLQVRVCFEVDRVWGQSSGMEGRVPQEGIWLWPSWGLIVCGSPVLSL